MRKCCSTGPFSIETGQLPGLVQTYIQGVEPPQVIGVHQMSAWLAEQVFQATRFENNTVHVFTIGPGIPCGQQAGPVEILAGIRTQLNSAINMADFKDFTAQLMTMVKALELVERANVLAVRSSVSQMGATPLQKAFFGAMAFDLEYVANLLN